MHISNRRMRCCSSLSFSHCYMPLLALGGFEFFFIFLLEKSCVSHKTDRLTIFGCAHTFYYERVSERYCCQKRSKQLYFFFEHMRFQCFIFVEGLFQKYTNSLLSLFLHSLTHSNKKSISSFPKRTRVIKSRKCL